MSVVNMDYILNGTDQKVFNLKYKEMKENYNETTAGSYFDVYRNQPLSFLLENSRFIFSEPIYGLGFYKESVFNNCAFLSLDDELEKIKAYREDISNKIDVTTEQRELYKELQSDMEAFIESHKNTITVAKAFNECVVDELLKENDGKINYKYPFEHALCDAISLKDDETVAAIMESVPEPLFEKASILYTPYIATCCGFGSKLRLLTEVKMIEGIVKKVEANENEFSESVVSAIVYANKLNCDEAYNESCKHVDLEFRNVISFFESASIEEYLNSCRTRKEKVVFHESPEDVIRSLFDDMDEDEIYKNEYAKESEKIESYYLKAYEETYKILQHELDSIEDITAEAVGYTINPNTSYENLVDLSMNIIDNSININEDAEDDEIDSLDDSKDDKKDSSDDGHYGDVSKKAKAPKPKNLANKVQFAAMDAEAKQHRKLSELHQKGLEKFNAVKASLQLPKNVADDIKKTAKNIDEWDDDRRKKYITEPGFRKKIFKNLKLAILYGSVAQVRLSLIPVTIAARSLSKKKNIRMRNELARELTTEIKVCEEKINDANSNNDTQEKYRLMRIRDQLEAELIRVRTNSKYI